VRTIRALLVTVLIVVVAFVAYTYLSGNTAFWSGRAQRSDTIGTSGKIDVNAARERGAEVGEKMAVAAAKVKETTAEAALTSKIKAKMVLDDYVKARAIDVTTSGSTVTVSGTVGSVEEHDRAIRLTRETAGVSQVIDHLTVAR